MNVLITKKIKCRSFTKISNINWQVFNKKNVIIIITFMKFTEEIQKSVVTLRDNRDKHRVTIRSPTLSRLEVFKYSV